MIKYRTPKRPRNSPAVRASLGLGRVAGKPVTGGWRSFLLTTPVIPAEDALRVRPFRPAGAHIHGKVTLGAVKARNRGQVTRREPLGRKRFARGCLVVAPVAAAVVRSGAAVVGVPTVIVGAVVA